MIRKINISLRKATSADVPNIYKWTMDTIDKKWWNDETYLIIIHITINLVIGI